MAHLPILPITEIKPIDKYAEIVSPKLEQIERCLPVDKDL